MKKGTLSDRVIEYILHCSLEELREVTVYRLAQFFKVNRCYLARRFKGDKDFTLCEFLVREKLIRAASILKESDGVTINELSEIIGFSNANYFIRIFKQYFGTSPGRYRECLRKRSSEGELMGGVERSDMKERNRPVPPVFKNEDPLPVSPNLRSAGGRRF